MMYLAKQKIADQYTGLALFRDAANHKELLDEFRAYGLEGDFEILDDSEFTDDDIDLVMKHTERSIAQMRNYIQIM